MGLRHRDAPAADPTRQLEAFEAVIEELREASGAAVVLVEGPNDLKALRHLGIDGPIRTLHGTTGLLAEADRIAADGAAVILLVDWDRKGGAIAERLKENLKGRVAVNLDLRRKLARVARVRCVEDLPAYQRLLMKRVEKH